MAFGLLKRVSLIANQNDKEEEGKDGGKHDVDDDYDWPINKIEIENEIKKEKEKRAC